MSIRQVVLASSSPRRATLLRQIGLKPVIEPAATDEAIDGELSPREIVTTLARRKAETVAARHQGQPVAVIGADTVVCVGDKVLGKPTDLGDAIAMLHQLSGTTHQVHTGVCVIAGTTGRSFAEVATTEVTMRPIEQGEVASYVSTGEPVDAAGAYAIQGRAAVFVERIVGDYTNVVGLPLAVTERLLDQAGMDITLGWARS